MNNRFKFRWYSKIYNEMCDVNCIEPNNEFVNFQQGKFNDISTRINLENGILMQCTGLKDKNGKLIYEGDILLDIARHDKPLYVVKWNKSQAQFYIEKINPKKYELYTEWHLGRHDLNYEVIGNIYENKSLLESEG